MLASARGCDHCGQVRYAAVRRQTAARAGEREVQVLDYQNTAADLLPLVAACYALIFMVRAWHAAKRVRVGLSALSSCDARPIAPRAIVSVLCCEHSAADKCLRTSVHTLCGITSNCLPARQRGASQGDQLLGLSRHPAAC